MPGGQGKQGHDVACQALGQVIGDGQGYGESQRFKCIAARPSQDVARAQELLKVIVFAKPGEEQALILAGEPQQNERDQGEKDDLSGGCLDASGSDELAERNPQPEHVGDGQGYGCSSGSDLLRSLVHVNRLPP